MSIVAGTMQIINMGMLVGVMFQAVRRKLPPSCSSLECQASQAVNNPELLLVGISLAVVVLFAVSYVEQAKSACSQEVNVRALNATPSKDLLYALAILDVQNLG